MNLNLKRNSKGFTIIEVLIVLAIAALIMLLVFLAVPTLQRNARNTARKSDIGRIGAATTTVISNNNGSVAALTDINLQAEVGTPSFYAVTSITVGSLTGHAANTSAIGTAIVYTGAICSGPTGFATATGATARSIAIEYTLEAAVVQCVNV